MKSIRNLFIYLSLFPVYLISMPAQAQSVMMIKGGGFKWSDNTQETAERDVRYEDRSETFILAFERRRRTVSMGAEFMNMESDWDKVDVLPDRPKGYIHLRSISFVPRAYLARGHVAPFLGAGIGWSYVRSRYVVNAFDNDVEREDGPIYQLNGGVEFRWEGVGLMFELKRIKVDIDDDSLSLSKADFPDISGTAGFVGLTLMF